MMKQSTIQSVILTAFVCILTVSVAYAQQDPYYSHFRFNKQAYNPAGMGMSDEWICVSMISHKQWVGYDDETWVSPTAGATDQVITNVAPITHNFNISAHAITLGNGHKLKAGMSVVQDLLGFMRTSTGKGQLCYQFPIGGPSGSLSVGLDFGFNQFGFINPQFKARQPFDPRVPKATVSDSKGDWGTGVLYRNKWVTRRIRNFYIGASIEHINEADFQLSGTGYKLQRHAYFHTGANIPSGSGAVVFEPAVLVKYNSKPQVDLSLTALRQKTWRGGIGYRQWGTTDALTILMGYVKGRLQLGYSYDITLSQIQTVSNGTHEIMVSYCFGKELGWFKTIREL